MGENLRKLPVEQFWGGWPHQGVRPLYTQALVNPYTPTMTAIQFKFKQAHVTVRRQPEM